MTSTLPLLPASAPIPTMAVLQPGLAVSFQADGKAAMRTGFAAILSLGLGPDKACPDPAPELPATLPVAATGAVAGKPAGNILPQAIAGLPETTALQPEVLAGLPEALAIAAEQTPAPAKASRPVPPVIVPRRTIAAPDAVPTRPSSPYTSAEEAGPAETDAATTTAIRPEQAAIATSVADPPLPTAAPVPVADATDRSPAPDGTQAPDRDEERRPRPRTASAPAFGPAQAPPVTVAMIAPVSAAAGSSHSAPADAARSVPEDSGRPAAAPMPRLAPAPTAPPVLTIAAAGRALTLPTVLPPAVRAEPSRPAPSGLPVFMPGGVKSGPRPDATALAATVITTVAPDKFGSAPPTGAAPIMPEPARQARIERLTFPAATADASALPAIPASSTLPEHPIGAAPTEPTATPVSQSGLDAVPAALASPPVSNPASIPANAPAHTPHDFSALVDRLVEARDTALAGQPVQTVQTVLSSHEFGPVSLRFDLGGDGLSVSMSSADPAFNRAVLAAAPLEAAPRGDTGGQANSSNQPQAGSGFSQSGQSSHGGSPQGRPWQDQTGASSARAAASPADASPANHPREQHARPLRQRGLFA